MVIPAIKLYPGPTPRALNIRSANSGNAAPKSERRKDAAAVALAAYLKLGNPGISNSSSEATVSQITHLSTRYIWIGRKQFIMPNAKSPDPRIGRIQCACLSADQPYQLQEWIISYSSYRGLSYTYKSPAGRTRLPKNITGSRNSGSATPLLRATSYITIH